MAQVDPTDDGIQRFVVLHYRYDPERNERRNMVVAAFDNANEFEDRIEELATALKHRREAGERVDALEQISGTIYEPRHLELQRNGHLLKRAFDHGVSAEYLESLELPSNVGFTRLGEPEARECE